MPATENLQRAEAQERASFLATDSYDVRLDLTTGPTTFRTETTIRFTASAARETFVDLIAPAVHEIELNGDVLPNPAERFDGARISLPAVREGENVVRVLADGAYMNTGEGLHRFVDPVDDEVYLYTQFEVSDARRMFACFEQPDLKATFRFTVTAPDHWRVMSNSPTPEPVPAGDGVATWEFSPTERISTYLTALVAGNYQGGEGSVTTRDGRTIPMGVFARASLAQYVDPQNVIDITEKGIAFYEERFDCDFPFRKYDQIFVPEYNMGAMENPGCVTYVESYVFRSEVSDAIRERRDLTILHELAHMWFGDLVTMRWWDDLWLNESFAEFASTTCMAEATKWTGAWTTFSSMEKEWAYAEDQLPSTHPIVADMVDFDAVETNFDGITYAKGASVLRQLVAYVGEDAFFEGLRAYFRAHAWGNTELKDLLVELEKTSGRDLGTWSSLWLEKAGVTLLRPVIQRSEDGTVTSFAVEQEAPADYPTLRPHRLRIGGYTLQGGRLTRTHQVEIDVDGARTDVPELAGQRADLWLINDDDLAYAKIRLDAQSLDTAIEHLRDIDDSLARTLIWGAAWDMVRDTELPASRYTDLLLANLTGEPDSSVVRTLLGRLTTVTRNYAAPALRQDRAERVADALWTMANQAKPGSDHQLQFLTSFAALATTPEQLDHIQGLFDGTEELPGREIDVDLRWNLTIALAAGGRFDLDDIDAVLAKDDTQSGRKSAYTAKAALPTPEAKAQAWQITVEQDELANESVTAVALGFVRVNDPSLIDEYTPRYFDALDTVWNERTSEIATRIIQGYFPRRFPTAELAARAEAWLEAHSQAPIGLRRPVLEALDEVKRSLRVHAADI
ncbi:aminopeptidase N [Devriesea agamarum]|uniref:aminopeptidase N n=1 Tax=Devriesea agamarum TaxID=472569 RepID=UPI00071C74EA|nr:aminopeptidase N [Devriesea agamarum]